MKINRLCPILLKGIIIILFLSTASANEDSAYKEARYYGAHLCAYSEFECVPVKPGETWSKLFPNQRERQMVMRLNRTNMPLRQRPWIVVPSHLSQMRYLDLSPFPARISSTGGKLVVVNLGFRAFAAYDASGKQIYWGPVSAGRGWCSDIHRICNTAVGNFRIISKGGSECISREYPADTEGGAPMPYCMFYFRGFALHGSTLPGYHDSHGCIRLFPEDAKWLNQHFVDVGTQVVVMD